MPPSAVKLVGDDAVNYTFGITEATVAFVTLESLEESKAAQKHEIMDQKNNVIAVGFSRMGERVFAMSGYCKGDIPAVGDTITFTAMDDSADITGVIGEDLKTAESNGDWRKISATVTHYPDMTIT